MNKHCVGVLGASSLVGQQVLRELVQAQCHVIAYSRTLISEKTTGVEWRQLGVADQNASSPKIITDWICVAPIWTLIEHLPLLQAYGVRRIIALSSTSRFTKNSSLDEHECEIAHRLTQAETALQDWAQQHTVTWVILRPTLIYGAGKDKNIAEIARFIRRFKFFPVFGKAQGLRQPVHAFDVAHTCVQALLKFPTITGAYNLSGAETLTYREMVERIFIVMQRSVCVLTVPLGIFRIALLVLRKLSRYRHWNVAMAMRMNSDLIFDHSDAVRDLAFNPRSFVLTLDDVR